jgi:tetratricopeptide (TPR) repeat protein
MALAMRLGARPTIAAAGALVFLAHPLCSAAVAYVSGRTDLLAVLFSLSALLCVAPAAALRPPASRVSGATPSIVRVAAIVLFVACAAFSKESGLLAGPLVCALWWLARADQSGVGTPGVRVGFAIPVAALATTVTMAAMIVPPALQALATIAPDVRLRAAGAALRTYASLLVMPAGLHLDRLTAAGGAADVALGAAASVAIVAAVVAFTLRPTVLRFALAALALAALPASNLLPIYPAIADRYVFTGEQLAYAPLAALGPLFACLLARGVEKLGGSAEGAPVAYTSLHDRLVPAAALAVACALAIVWSRPTLARQHDLADAETTYRATLAHSPSPRACFNLGVTLLERGRDDEAARVYERCVELSPNDAAVQVQLGVAHQKSGRTAEAEHAYIRALELDANDPYAWSSYASLQASAGRYAEAREKWGRALELEPGFAPALEGLSKLDVVERRTEVSGGSPRALPPPS